MAEQNHWDQRYSAPGYRFGKEPAEFLRREAGQLAKGSRVLCLADGEGRNSVHLASLGHDVTAFDASGVALVKARDLAAERGLSVDFNLSGVEDWDWSQQYDAVVGVFIQFAGPDLQKQMFDWMKGAVAPGGLLLLHGYIPRQLEYKTGGPGVAENMYTKALLRDAFADFEMLTLRDYDAEIDEGPGHSGLSALIDFVGRKPG
ncbi:MAG: cyclopropane fatty-acyl-phospholipid synthase-like methyltransferase [Paracoccaceae bacterium]|jgi:cyclopropane fatty-acyl-phospholipid synthase-like methyltransferase